LGTSILFCYGATNLNVQYPIRIGAEIQILQPALGEGTSMETILFRGDWWGKYTRLNGRGNQTGGDSGSDYS